MCRCMRVRVCVCIFVCVWDVSGAYVCTLAETRCDGVGCCCCVCARYASILCNLSVCRQLLPGGLQCPYSVSSGPVRVDDVADSKYMQRLMHCGLLLWRRGNHTNAGRVSCGEWRARVTVGLCVCASICYCGWLAGFANVYRVSCVRC